MPNGASILFTTKMTCRLTFENDRLVSEMPEVAHLNRRRRSKGHGLVGDGRAAISAEHPRHCKEPIKMVTLKEK